MGVYNQSTGQSIPARTPVLTNSCLATIAAISRSISGTPQRSIDSRTEKLNSCAMFVDLLQTISLRVDPLRAESGRFRPQNGRFGPVATPDDLHVNADS